MYWAWKSRRRWGGRPAIDPEVRELIRAMSRNNIGWGAPATARPASMANCRCWGHERREIVHVNAMYHPTADWNAQQLVEAFAFDTAPRYLMRDRDSIYGERFRTLVKAPGYRGVHHCASLALAKSLCRANHRLNPTRVFKSRRHFQ